MKRRHGSKMRLAGLLLAVVMVLISLTVPAMAAEARKASNMMSISTSLDSADNVGWEDMTIFLSDIGQSINMNSYKVIGSDTEITVSAVGQDTDYFGWVNSRWLVKTNLGFYMEHDDCIFWGCSLRENGEFMYRTINEKEDAPSGQAMQKLAPGESVTFTGKDLLGDHDVDLANAICVVEVGAVYPENGDLRDSRNLIIFKLDDQKASELSVNVKTPAEPGNPFTDVPVDAYYHDAVLWALEKNITTGMTETTFGPTQTCTRGQVATFLWRAKGCPEPETKENPFKDVKETDYFFKAVLWAYENGITTGTSETAFSPNGTCTSAQVVTFLWRANGKPAAEYTGTEYYAEAVAWANANGLLEGTATPFTPSAPSPRADIVTYLYRDLSEDNRSN